MSFSLQTQLQQGAKQLGQDLTETQINQLQHYLQLLEKWNKAYNLTAITSLEKMVSTHILDSLTLCPHAKGKRVLDVGTGAGLPGIPLAIVMPEQHFTLLDSNGKKIRFLRQVVLELGLKNVEPTQARMEKYQTTQCFNVIMARAVAEVAELIEKSQHLLCADGQFLFMKGRDPQRECDELKEPYSIHALTVPGLSAQRHVIIASKQGDSDDTNHSDH